MADNRPPAVFFRPLHYYVSMSGNGGDTFGYAGFRMHRFANPNICRSPRLATGCAVLQLHTGGHYGQSHYLSHHASFGIIQHRITAQD
ncbi:hypothetical protein ACFFKC_09950 [Pseudoduganella danionis]|uniref:Uncharacterized protein n=1 Tax=Pseudoduganella danionis TaxID=1890295 RepID=A0ABW9SN57_9BURK|nr:hypothetical protein [Pseudoduganella danionis]MTW32653.1 hypothetical protein [Pseudoduganella danionis]